MAKWYSENTNIATVVESTDSDHAIVTAVSPGKTYIYAKDDTGKVTERFAVTVAEGSGSLLINCLVRFNVDVVGAKVTIGKETKLCSDTMSASPFQKQIDSVNGTKIHYVITAEGYKDEVGEYTLQYAEEEITVSMTELTPEDTSCDFTAVFDNAELVGTIVINGVTYSNVHSQTITVDIGSTVSVSWSAEGYNSDSRTGVITSNTTWAGDCKPIEVTVGTVRILAPVSSADFYLNGQLVRENASSYDYVGTIGEEFDYEVKQARGYLDYKGTTSYANKEFTAPMTKISSNLVTDMPTTVLQKTANSFTATVDSNTGQTLGITWSSGSADIVEVSPSVGSGNFSIIGKENLGKTDITATWYPDANYPNDPVTKVFKDVSVVSDGITITSSLDGISNIFIPNGVDVQFTASAKDSLDNPIAVAINGLSGVSTGAATITKTAEGSYRLRGRADGSFSFTITAGTYVENNQIKYRASKTYTGTVVTPPSTIQLMNADSEEITSIEMVRSTPLPPDDGPIILWPTRTSKTLKSVVGPSTADVHHTVSSANASIATISGQRFILQPENLQQNWFVFGESYGKTTVTVTATMVGNNSASELSSYIVPISKSVNVSVYAVIADKKSLSVNVGETATIGIAELEAGYTEDDVTFTPYSTQGGQVTVDSDGVVTGVYPGIASVEVHVNGLSGEGSSYWVTVMVNATNTTYINGVSLDDVSLYAGETAEITASLDTTTDYYTIPASRRDPELVWSSDDEDVAVVEVKNSYLSGGANHSTLRAEITGKTVGTANITATTGDGRYTATCEVTVVAARKRISYNWKWVDDDGVTVLSNTLPSYLQPDKTYKFLLTVNSVDSVAYTGSINVYLSSSVVKTIHGNQVRMDSVFTGTWNSTTRIFTLDTPSTGLILIGEESFDEFQNENITMYATFGATSDYKGTTYDRTFTTAKKLKAVFENENQLSLKVGEAKTYTIDTSDPDEYNPELYMQNNSYHGYTPDFSFGVTSIDKIDFAPIFWYASHTGGLNPVYSEVFRTAPWYEDPDESTDDRLDFVGPTLYGKAAGIFTDLHFSPKVYADDPHKNTSYYGTVKIRGNVSDEWITAWKTAHPQDDQDRGLDIKGLTYEAEGESVMVFDAWWPASTSDTDNTLIHIGSTDQTEIEVRIISRYIDGHKLPFKLTYGNEADDPSYTIDLGEVITEAGHKNYMRTLNDVGWSSDTAHFVVLDDYVTKIDESDAGRTDLVSRFKFTVAENEGTDTRYQLIDVTTVYGTIRLVVEQIGVTT